MARKRVDVVLVEQELFASQQEASRAILAGEVFFDTPAHDRVNKPGEQVDEATRFDVKTVKKYVSRGGEKIKGALSAFGYDMTGKHVLDAGASTGGFTDCVLQEGARSVSAVDVGYGQLAWKLRNDPRVSVFDRLNIRDARPKDIGGPFDVVVADLSFIPLEKVIGALKGMVVDGGDFILLVKPQFEADPDDVGHHGVVRESEVHKQVLARVLETFESFDLTIHDVTFSPIKGPEGNIEFWIYGSKVAPTQEHGGPDISAIVSRTVDEANRVLG